MKYIFFLTLFILSGNFSFSQSYINLKAEIDSLGESFYDIPGESLIQSIKSIQSKMENVSSNDSIWFHYSEVIIQICHIRELNELGLNVTDQISKVKIIRNDSLYYPMTFTKYSNFYHSLGMIDSSNFYNDKAISIAEKNKVTIQVKSKVFH